MSKPSLRDLLKKKKKDPEKETDLEKGDFLALLIAGVTVFFPILIAAVAILALFIFGWNAFFG